MLTTPKLYCAIDTSSDILAQTIVTELGLKDEPVVDGFKIGLQFYMAYGKVGIRKLFTDELKSRNIGLFLDLKFYDIPNTVKGAMASVADLEPNYLTVHASHEDEEILASVGYVGKYLPKTEVIGVTTLTSSSDNNLDNIVKVAELVKKHGLDGITCPGYSVSYLRKMIPSPLTIITPGIRPSFYDKDDDQNHIRTPIQAITDGSNVLVVGRPITGSSQKYDMRARAKMIKDEMMGVK